MKKAKAGERKGGREGGRKGGKEGGKEGGTSPLTAAEGEEGLLGTHGVNLLHQPLGLEGGREGGMEGVQVR